MNNKDQVSSGTFAIERFMEELSIAAYSVMELYGKVLSDIFKYGENEDRISRLEQLIEIINDGKPYVVKDRVNADKEYFGVENGGEVWDFFSDTLVYDHLTSDIFDAAEARNIDLDYSTPLDELVTQCRAYETGSNEEQEFFKVIKGNVEFIEAMLHDSEHADMDLLIEYIPETARSIPIPREKLVESDKWYVRAYAAILGDADDLKTLVNDKNADVSWLAQKAMSDIQNAGKQTKHEIERN